MTILKIHGEDEELFLMFWVSIIQILRTSQSYISIFFHMVLFMNSLFSFSSFYSSHLSSVLRSPWSPPRLPGPPRTTQEFI